MKTTALKLKTFILILFLSLFSAQYLLAQDQNEGLGLPGDNLNLSAVLDIFQKSKTLEDFERTLNSESNKINNLDLNNDSRTDYIKVIDNPQDNTHAIVLQVDLNGNESQDIAVIYVDKDRNGNTDIQIVGDEDLYGSDYVVEPRGETPNPGYSDNNYNNNNYNNNNYTPVSEWVVINYIYSPFYSNYISPWYWGYYPGWWNPWSPFYWNDYYYHCYHRYNWYWNWNYYSYHRHNRFRSQHANWYRKEHRRTSSTYNRYRKEGVYTKSYQGNPPSVRPNPVSVNKAGRPVVERANTPTIDRKGEPVINRQTPTTERKTDPVINRQQNVQPNREPVMNRPVERPREQLTQPGSRPQQIERPSPQPAPRPVERSTPAPSPRPVERSTPAPTPRSVERSTPAPTPRQETRPTSPPVQRSAPNESRPAQQPQSAPRRR